MGEGSKKKRVEEGRQWGKGGESSRKGDKGEVKMGKNRG